MVADFLASTVRERTYAIETHAHRRGTSPTMPQVSLCLSDTRGMIPDFLA